eukprot:4701726-Prymnesium_polylepis.2
MLDEQVEREVARRERIVPAAEVEGLRARGATCRKAYKRYAGDCRTGIKGRVTYTARWSPLKSA